MYVTEEDIIDVSYKEAEKYIYSLERFGIKLGLRNMHRILKALHIPYQKLPVIHIAGTNGKGSTAIMTAHMLAACRLKVGLYTSPHLTHIRERIRIFQPGISQNKYQYKYISPANFSRIARLLRVSSRSGQLIPLTFFEALTATAIKYFLDEQVDCAIFETGLGGRLDATNVLKPLVCMITNVDKEHTQWLGTSLVNIAKEKAGIIKKNIPCVTMSEHACVVETLKKQCRKLNAPFYAIVKGGKNTHSHAKHLDLVTPHMIYSRMETPLMGAHQHLNAAGAICVVDLLRKKYNTITTLRMQQGLHHTCWPGRFERIQKSPEIIIDSAHNQAAFSVLRDTLNQYYSNHTIYLILSILDDKDYQAMCQVLLPTVHKSVQLVRLPTHRSAGMDQLRAYIQRKKYSAVIYDDVRDAYRASRSIMTKNCHRPGLILITGSIYLVGMARGLLGQKSSL